MSVEDKIKRAEEIYNRRRENESKTTNARVRVESNKIKSNKNINQKLKKMIVQIVVCMLIYLTFHFITNSEYEVLSGFKSKCEEVLSYDISFSSMYEKASEGIKIVQQKYNEIIEKSKSNNQKEQSNENNTVEENVQSNDQENIEKVEEKATEQEETLQTNENIGGTVEEVVNIETEGEAENLSEEEQMKKDAEEIKAKISFIKPLVGTITSVFGWRNPKVSTVSKYHTGIDIAANQGTNIISATNGKVILASSSGAYGNHLKIQIEDTIIIYAHCLSLEVKEGDTINQGQTIAKVGSTGNSTGPHLHFEIRKENRYVNPQLILDL